MGKEWVSEDLGGALKMLHLVISFSRFAVNELEVLRMSAFGTQPGGAPPLDAECLAGSKGKHEVPPTCRVSGLGMQQPGGRLVWGGPVVCRSTWDTGRHIRHSPPLCFIPLRKICHQRRIRHCCEKVSPCLSVSAEGLLG